ncbi:MAG: sulfurase [Paenibacillus sp. RIFOXYA1_FULL_44_5]|nr:MAG: sulfurase [Paenibacillus sp. RIFOXYA1_FULL_44_5]
MQEREVKSLSIGLPKNNVYEGEPYRSGIWKEQVDELFAGFQRIAGDDVDNHIYHGGVDRAVCVYPFEHYDYWKKQFGVPLSTAAFGENLIVSNMKEDQVCIGDIYQIGDAVLQISQGRYPCETINKRNHNEQLLEKVIQTGYTGYFFRVLKEGKINLHSKIEQLYAHPKKVTVAAIHDLYFHDSPTEETILNILEIEELAEPWRAKLKTRLS